MYFNESIKLAKEKFGDEVSNILISQKQKYDKLSKMNLKNNIKAYINNGVLIIPENALIHATSFDISKFVNIKKEGILSSEFALNKKDMYNETFFLADFFKNVSGRDLTVAELLNCCNKNNIKYLPSINGATNQVGFIVNTYDANMKTYLQIDLFNEKNSMLLPFINEEFFFSLERRKKMPQYNFILGQSSLPIGVPYNALCGIIVDSSIEQNKEKMDIISKIFGKDLYIVSAKGYVLSTPEQNNNKNEQIDEICL